MEENNSFMFDDLLNDDLKLDTPIQIQNEMMSTDEYLLDNTKHEAIIQKSSLKNYTQLDINQEFNAKVYKFELDTFQKIALAAIEADRSLLVSAHTSCGKTVVAEYAIAKSIKNKQRVIYTSPIKALSNQKFRELQEEFVDVGLMTGDVTLNPDATVLVMTTEILRNMLYRGSEITREIHWIIFDEIHYLKDRERGVVWEETLILLKDHVRSIFLSATIPNAREFAEWICKLSKQTVHVVYTEKRVIPLQHYFYADKMYLVKNDKFDMRATNEALQNVIRRNEMTERINECLMNIEKPLVVFSFARAKCEFYASKITKTLVSREEREMIERIFDNAIESLSDKDIGLKAVQIMKEYFLKGIGVHHSGLLPIVKEIGEILFQEGLIKILFATESFSIGLNMPAKTVLFTSLKKFDGQSERTLTSSEYAQMSGRAGRRGKDKEGRVVSMITNEITTEEIVEMFKTSADELKSAFRLTYNMILNLMRVEELNPTYFLEKSFYHYQAYSKALKMEEKLKIEIEDYRETEENVEIKQSINKVIKGLLVRNDYIRENYRDILETRRYVEINSYMDGAIYKCKGILVGYKDKINIQILNNGESEIVTFNNTAITDVCGTAGKFKDEKVLADRASEIKWQERNDQILYKEIKNCLIREMTKEGVCLLCGRMQVEGCKMKENDCKMKNEEEFKLNLFTLQNESPIINRYMTKHKLKIGDYEKDIEELMSYRRYLIYLINRDQIEKTKKDLKKAKEIYHMEECKKMINVLRDLEYLDGNRVLLKGKMASEISSADELLLTEMIFDSSFNQLDIKDMVAMISILVTERAKEGESVVISEENMRLKELFESSLYKIVSIMNKNGIKISIEEYESNYYYYMMDIVKLWMGGCTFAEICSQTKVFEGSIIRAFKRLEEVLRQLSNAATVIGNNDLVNLFGQGIYLIKRDIVFANSLYL